MPVGGAPSQSITVQRMENLDKEYFNIHIQTKVPLVAYRIISSVIWNSLVCCIQTKVRLVGAGLGLDLDADWIWLAEVGKKT